MTRDAIDLGADPSEGDATKLAAFAIGELETMTNLLTSLGKVRPLEAVVVVVELEGGESGIGSWRRDEDTATPRAILERAASAIAEAGG